MAVALTTGYLKHIRHTRQNITQVQGEITANSSYPNGFKYWTIDNYVPSSVN